MIVASGFSTSSSIMPLLGIISYICKAIQHTYTTNADDNNNNTTVSLTLRSIYRLLGILRTDLYQQHR